MYRATKTSESKSVYENIPHGESDVTLERQLKRRKHNTGKGDFKMWGHSLMGLSFPSASLPALSPTVASPFKSSFQIKGIKDTSAPLSAESPMSLKHQSPASGRFLERGAQLRTCSGVTT